MKIKAIVTGATGMVGEGVLHECLIHEDVDSILVIGRRSCGINHHKLKEIIHDDFYDYDKIRDQLSGFNACFFCLGVSSLGMKEERYHKITFELTTTFAKTLSELNPDMTFCYVSGAGTDSSGKGRSMWARVKGKTENSLLKLPFKQAYMFRPGYMQPTKGLKNTLTMYKIMAPLYPVWKLLIPKYISTLKDVGIAMINSVKYGYDKSILETGDINKLAGIRK